SGAPLGPETWTPALDAAAAEDERKNHRRRQRAETFLLGPVGRPGAPLIGWLTAGIGDADNDVKGEARGRAHVRDDGGETLEVLVLIRKDDQLMPPDWLDKHGAIPLSPDIDPGPAIARVIASCSLPLPRAVTDRDLDSIIDELEQRNGFPGWQ